MKLTSTFFFLFAFLFSCVGIQAQVTLPPSGGNQKASVTQHLGMVSITVDYSSPDVAGREDKIWGQLVAYGPSDLKASGFGTATAAPWRAGANENTIITVSHDVLVQGEKLPAGTYGLHMFTAAEGPWEVVFSANYDSWGSYFYDQDEDVLRVEVTPEECAFQEYLTYEFTERKIDTATLALKWEKLAVPMQFVVEDAVGLYIAQLRNDMRNSSSFNASGMRSAAGYCLQNQRNLEEALEWIDMSMHNPFYGEKNFAAMQTKTQLLFALERKEDAHAALEETLAMPADALPVFQFGTGFLQGGNMEAAKTVFTACQEQHPDSWATYSGWGLIYAAEGEKKTALKHFEKALKVAPPFAQNFIQGQIAQLKG
jgi:tetratricopeptide (TPR) repeat protein